MAFIGESGAGKTTLVDIILGLFRPEKGNVLVDGKNLHDQKIIMATRKSVIFLNLYFYQTIPFVEISHLG